MYINDIKEKIRVNLCSILMPLTIYFRSNSDIICGMCVFVYVYDYHDYSLRVMFILSLSRFSYFSRYKIKI